MLGELPLITAPIMFYIIAHKVHKQVTFSDTLTYSSHMKSVQECSCSYFLWKFGICSSILTQQLNHTQHRNAFDLSDTPG